MLKASGKCTMQGIIQLWLLGLHHDANHSP
jgi:hypothetical protein